MRLPGLVRPLTDAANGDDEAAEQALEPAECRHVEMSNELIGRAALEVHPGRALILGAGACREIPLVSLAQRFESILLQDQDPDDMAVALELLSTAQTSAVVTTEVRDLTGITDNLIERAESCLLVASSPDHAVDLLVELVRDATVGTAPSESGWDLVVASCVPTQLHIRVLNGITTRYRAQFPDKPDLLVESPAWTDAMTELSWRLQEEFIEQLLDLVARNGRIYLSATVQVGMLYKRLAGGWRTPGWYRMMRGRVLAASLPPSARALWGGQWPHIVAAPTFESAGMLYNVHAVILARDDADLADQ